MNKNKKNNKNISLNNNKNKIISENKNNKYNNKNNNFLKKKKIKKDKIDKLNKKNKVNINNNILDNLDNCLKLKLKRNKRYISLLKNKLFILKKKYKDLNLRWKADIDNINKRNKKNIENIYKYSLEKFAINILPIIDSLKYALKNSKNKEINNNITYEGINLILKNFLYVIKKFGISVISKINIKFNPEYHQAMIVEESNNINKNNIVVSVLQDGYIMNKRLLRPAMVKVIKYKK